MTDKDGKGIMSLEDAMKILYLRNGREVNLRRHSTHSKCQTQFRGQLWGQSHVGGGLGTHSVQKLWVLLRHSTWTSS